MTKANRRRKNKGGRPRIEGVEREPNGQPSRRKSVRAERDSETAAETRKVAVEARMRLYGGSAEECERHEYGSVLGRLYLARRIKKHHFDAGSRMAEDFARYYGLTGIPYPSAKAQDISRVKGLGSDPNPEKVKAASNRVMAIEQKLGLADIQGRPVTSVCKRVCIMDDSQGMEFPHMIGFLVKGLNALAVYYGVDMQEDA